MAKILHFDKLFNRRAAPTEQPKIKLTLKRASEPPKAA